MSTLKLGWTNPLRDAFGAHPVLGPVLDLNDGVNFTLVSSEGLELPAPKRTLVPAGNIRTQGERAVRAVYRHNREAVCRLIVGPGASYAALIATVRTLVDWLSSPPSVPITIQYQPFNASQPVYLDVVGAAHTIPSDESQWLRLQFEPIEIVFVARPGLRGDRVTLQNLAANPGFELPSGPGVQVFTDTFANANAYALLVGGAPSVSANVMTIPSGGWVAFGSPSWGAVQTWQVRFQFATGLTANFYVHLADANNWLLAQVTGSALSLQHDVAGTVTTIATASWAPVNGSFYWLRVTQFPSVAGDPPYVQATLYLDAGGSIGSQNVQVGGGAADAAAGLSGRPQIRAIGAALALGGNFAGVHTVALFGPGGWLFQPIRSGATSTGACSGGWDTATTAPLNLSNPSSGLVQVPVNSYGAARIDLPPGGTVDSCWRLYVSGAVSGSNLIRSGFNHPMGFSFACTSSGINAANGRLVVTVTEFDGTGAFLTSANPINVALPTSWATITGSYTPASPTCTYIDICLRVLDTAVAGESANGTVWLDNVLIWDQLTTGETSMPYCELRFAQSPAQLVVSGLLGDLPAPAYVALGTYVSSLPTGGAINFALGRRGSVSASARLVGNCVGWHTSGLSPQSVSVLDAASWGGWYEQATVGGGGWNPRPLSPTAADEPGVYHMLCRFLSQQIVGNLPSVQVRAVTQQRSQAWYGALNGSDQLGAYNGTFLVGILGASNTWTVVDAGQVALPPYNVGALTDPTQTYLTPRAQWSDTSGSPAGAQVGWGALLPIDGSLLVGVLNNPSNAPGAVVSSYLFAYFDGLLTNRAGALDGPAWTWSQEALPLPNPAHAGGGPGTTGSGVINVNSGADPYLTLDPTLEIAGGNGTNLGVNQMMGYAADQNGAVLPLLCDIQYSPLFLYPR